ncbi:hypothetical protein ACET3Z_027502 [Daucus carota]
MAYLFDNDSSSSSDHDNFDYASVANPFMRRKKANVVNEVIYVEEDDYVDKGKKKVIFVDDEDDCHDNSGKKDDNTSFGRSERKNDYDNVDVGEKIHDFTFSNMNDVVPCSGMLFDNLDEVERFYRDYGRRVGFEVIIRNTHRHSRSNEACSPIKEKKVRIVSSSFGHVRGLKKI